MSSPLISSSLSPCSEDIQGQILLAIALRFKIFNFGLNYVFLKLENSLMIFFVHISSSYRQFFVFEFC